MKLLLSILTFIMVCANANESVYVGNNSFGVKNYVLNSYTVRVDKTKYKIIINMTPNEEMSSKLCSASKSNFVLCNNGKLINITDLYYAEYYDIDKKSYCDSNLYIEYKFAMSNDSAKSLEQLHNADCDNQSSWDTDDSVVSTKIFEYLSSLQNNNKIGKQLK